MTFEIAAPAVGFDESVVTQKLAFMGRSGSGKTYAAGKLAERLLENDAQVVVVDPVGVWWGLRLKADGKRAGFPIPVLGGQHGDIPLEVTGGKLVAETVASKGASMVLDVSEFTPSEMRRFVTDFALELLAAKKRHPSALMVIWEECQDFVPQHVRGDVAKMVGAMERLIKIGRNVGVGTTLISQRPQAVNKDVLNQTEVLLVFQLTGPQERKAVEGWIGEKGMSLAQAVPISGRREMSDDDDRDRLSLADLLPRLKPGHAFLWSPQWLERREYVHVATKTTFDASATPKFGAGRRAQELAPIDLQAISDAMKETVERAKATDPSHLKQRIVALESEIASLRAYPRAPKTETRVVERAVVKDAQLKALSAEVGRMGKIVDGVKERIGDLIMAMGKVMPEPKIADQSRVLAKKTPVLSFASPPTAAAPKNGEVKMDRADREILRALVAVPGGAASKLKIAVLAGYTANGGGFGNALGRLKGSGYIASDGIGGFIVTDAGRAVAPPVDAPTSPAQLLEFWTGKLVGKERDILRWMVANYDGHYTKPEIAEAVEMKADGGGFGNYVGRLTSLGLLVKMGSQYACAPELKP